MIALGPQTIFIAWAYLGVAIAVAGLVLWTLFDAHSTAKTLANLEARRPHRRTAK